MNLGLENKVVIVTGGAKGIGEGIVRAFAAEGAVPVIFGRSPEAGEKLVADLEATGLRAIFTEVELTSDDAIRGAVEKTSAQFGRIDGIVNNAGVNDGVGLEDSPARFTESLQKNLVHCFALVHHSLDRLKEARGFILNIGSKVAATGQGHTSGYAASKGGMNALTREWALDLAADGIRVNAVIPAEVMTPMYRNWLDTLDDPETTLREIENRIPLGMRMTTSDEIAAMTVFLASERSSHTTGQVIYVDGGYVHFDRAYGTIVAEK